jgi:hypothetical protein
MAAWRKGLCKSQQIKTLMVRVHPGRKIKTIEILEPTITMVKTLFMHCNAVVYYLICIAIVLFEDKNGKTKKVS